MSPADESTRAPDTHEQRSEADSVPDRLRELGTQLITRHVGSVRLGRRRSLRRVFSRIREVAGAELLQLFTLNSPSSKIRMVRLRLHSRSTGASGIPDALRQFPFRLLPGMLGGYISAGQIIRLNVQSQSGRLLSAVMNDAKVDHYLICPLQYRGESAGILGVGTSLPIDCEETALALQHNGQLLLAAFRHSLRERHRQHRESQWKAIADRACEFALQVDDSLTVTASIPFGLGEETPDFTGQRLEDIAEPSSYRLLRDQLDVCREKNEVRSLQIRLRFSRGAVRWCLVRIEPGLRPSESRFTVYVSDHEAERNTQENLRRLQEELQIVSRQSILGQLSTQFSHQLKQPMQTICNETFLQQELLRAGKFDLEQYLTGLQRIETGALQARELLSSIREYVKHRKLSPEDLSLDELIRSAVLLADGSLHESQAGLCLPEMPLNIVVRCDRIQTTHVLINLMVNAIEACSGAAVRKPRIVVGVRIRDRTAMVEVTVRDNGPGIPEGRIADVFRKFHTTKPGGLGIGLTVSRDVCESQGGRLWAANNADGPGCTFGFTMPLVSCPVNDTREIPAIPSGEPPAD